MPNPNRPEKANSIAPGAIVAMLTIARIQHEGVTNRYIDTNTGRRAAFDQWRALDAAGTADTDLGASSRPAVIAGERAPGDVGRRRQHRPDDDRGLGVADIDAEFAHRAVVTLAVAAVMVDAAKIFG